MSNARVPDGIIVRLVVFFSLVGWNNEVWLWNHLNIAIDYQFFSNVRVRALHSTERFQIKTVCPKFNAFYVPPCKILYIRTYARHYSLFYSIKSRPVQNKHVLSHFEHFFWALVRNEAWQLLEYSIPVSGEHFLKNI